MRSRILPGWRPQGADGAARSQSQNPFIPPSIPPVVHLYNERRMDGWMLSSPAAAQR